MTFRGFIAVEFDAKPLAQVLKELGAVDGRLKCVEPRNIHMTLKFLGDTKEEHVPRIQEVMETAVEGIQPFDVALKSLGAFPNTGYIKVVWVGLENAEALGEMSKRLNTALKDIGYRPEKKPFRPHITLARVKSIRDKRGLVSILDSNQNTEFATQHVERIVLKQSQLTPNGPIYTDLVKANLPQNVNSD